MLQIATHIDIDADAALVCETSWISRPVSAGTRSCAVFGVPRNAATRSS